MSGKRRWLAIALAATVATFGVGLSAGADSASEGSFLAKINASRSAQGLGPLSVDGGLRSHARHHTQDMIAAGEIYHSSSGELQSAAGSGWEKLGENVGRGGTVNSLYSAFMASSSHRANILGDYNKVGIGTDTSEGILYVTMVFMKKGGSPETTTTTTTTAPTTTTTAPAPTTTEGGTAPTTTQASNDTEPSSGSIPATAPADAPATTTTLVVGPDKPVTPGQSCVEATRFWWTCHD